MRDVKEAEEEAAKSKDEEREAARRDYVPLRKRIAKVRGGAGAGRAWCRLTLFSS